MKTRGYRGQGPPERFFWALAVLFILALWWEGVVRAGAWLRSLWR